MKKNLQSRIPELDVARGIAVILMMADHVMFDLWGIMPELFDGFADSPVSLFAHDYWVWDVRIWVRFGVLAVFMLLVGICCSLSRSNLLRGAKLMGVAVLLTLATFAVGKVIGDRDITITFGVLHCIALALILIGICEKFIKSGWVYLAVGAVMVTVGALLYPHATYVHYGSENLFVLIAKQIVGVCECGGDCFPLFLFGGQIFIGVFLGKLLYAGKKSVFKAPSYPRSLPGRFVCFVGRNSLIVYFAHQVIIPVLLAAILLICGYKISL